MMNTKNGKSQSQSHPDVPSTLGARLLQQRLRRKKNQLTVADDLHVTTSAVSLWEQDKRRPTLEMLKRLAEYYGVTVYYLEHGAEMSNDNYIDLTPLSLFQRRIVKDIVREFSRSN